MRWKLPKHWPAWAGAVVVVLATGIILIVNALTPKVYTGPEAFENYTNAWHLSKGVSNQHGYLYGIADCRLTEYAQPVSDRPLIPIGLPVRSWKVEKSNGNWHPGHCGHQPMNSLWVISPGPGLDYPSPLPPTWVYSTLGPAAAFHAHLIPTMPIEDAQHRGGAPGYFYELTSTCTQVTWVIRTAARPLITHYDAEPSGQVDQTESLALTNGTFYGGRCFDKGYPATIIVPAAFGPVQFYGMWVFSSLPPPAAYRAHVIPTLPAHPTVPVAAAP